MCRSIVRFFLATFIILFGTLLVLLLNLRLRLLESNYYKSFLKDNNVYALSIQTGKDFLENPGSEKKGTLLIQPVIDTVITDFLTPQLMQTVAERNLDNIFAFLNGRSERFYIYFPKEEFLAKLDTKTIDNLENEINTLIKSLPKCPPGQSNQFEGGEVSITSRVECLPEGFQAPTQDFSKLLADIQAYTGKNPLEGIFETGGPLAGLSEQTDVAKFIKDSPREPGAPDPEKAFSDVQRGFSYFNIGLIAATFLLLVSIVLYVLLGDKSKIFNSLGIIFLLLGISAGIVGAILTFSGVISKFIFDRLIAANLSMELLARLSFLPDVISKFFSGAFSPIFITGILMIVTGIIFLLVQKFLVKEKPEQVKMKIKTENKGTDKTEVKSSKQKVQNLI